MSADEHTPSLFKIRINCVEPPQLSIVSVIRVWKGIGRRYKTLLYTDKTSNRLVLHGVVEFWLVCFDISTSTFRDRSCNRFDEGPQF